MNAQIDIINYPFGSGAANNRSSGAPHIIEQVVSPLLSPYIGKWKNTKPDDEIPLGRDEETGLNNLEAVTDAVTKLGSEVMRTIWRGGKPLALGGGHSQGISTLKATALALLTKAIANKEIAINSQLDFNEFNRVISGFAIHGETEIVAKLIKTAIEEGYIQQNDINAFIDNIAVIWVDAHADYNDQHTSESGNIHGMPLAAATGRPVGGIENLFGGDFIKLNPENCYLLCTRDLDNKERANLDKDGVHYKEWELTNPGAMRTPADPDNTTTLKAALDDIFERTGDKRIIFSLDVDGLHAGIEESSEHGRVGLPATGTPMGLKSLVRVFGQTSPDTSDDLIRKNIHGKSPAGPSIDDGVEAIQDILNNERVVAADLSESSYAMGTKGKPREEEPPGLTLQTTAILLAAMVGADLEKFVPSLRAKQEQTSSLVRAAITAERQAYIKLSEYHL